MAEMSFENWTWPVLPMETRNTEDAAVPPLFQLLLRGFEQLKPGFTNYQPRGIGDNIITKSMIFFKKSDLKKNWNFLENNWINATSLKIRA